MDARLTGCGMLRSRGQYQCDDLPLDAMRTLLDVIFQPASEHDCNSHAYGLSSGVLRIPHARGIKCTETAGSLTESCTLKYDMPRALVHFLRAIVRDASQLFTYTIPYNGNFGAVVYPKTNYRLSHGRALLPYQLPQHSVVQARMLTCCLPDSSAAVVSSL